MKANLHDNVTVQEIRLTTTFKKQGDKSVTKEVQRNCS